MKLPLTIVQFTQKHNRENVPTSLRIPYTACEKAFLLRPRKKRARVHRRGNLGKQKEKDGVSVARQKRP